MNAAEAAVREGRQRIAELGGAVDEPQVELFEVALDVFVPKNQAA